MLDDLLRRQVRDLTEVCCPDDQLPVRLMDALVADEEIQAIQEYANVVSITRIGLNDHGPVHMRLVCRNAMRILMILHEAGIRTSLVEEGSGNIADSIAAVILASMLHDTGMTVGRKDHEMYSCIMSYGIIHRLLEKVLPSDEDLYRRTVIGSVALEGIIGHMGTHLIHSVEAGLILVSDGCDMTKGRARIIMESQHRPEEGDIHKYSASSIEKVKILPGKDKPVHIEVLMRGLVGFFQVEEVLIPKIHNSTIGNHIELYAGVIGEELKRYM